MKMTIKDDNDDSRHANLYVNDMIWSLIWVNIKINVVMTRVSESHSAILGRFRDLQHAFGNPRLIPWSTTYIRQSSTDSVTYNTHSAILDRFRDLLHAFGNPRPIPWPTSRWGMVCWVMQLSTPLPPQSSQWKDNIGRIHMKNLLFH